MKPNDIVRYSAALNAVQRGGYLTDKLIALYNEACETIVVNEETNEGHALLAWFPELGAAMAKAIAKAAQANVETNQKYLDMVKELVALEKKPKPPLRVKGGLAS
jgi:hypothetical protein